MNGNRAPRYRRGRPSLGFFINLVNTSLDKYQLKVWTGVIEAARDHDVHLVCFAGGGLGSPLPFDAQRNIVYDLAGPENIDGLVLMGGSLSSHIGPDRMRSFCAAYQQLPMVSIGFELEGIPSLSVDNRQAVRDVVRHLAEIHGRRRIAFVRGLAGNVEAEERFEAYRAALSELGIAYDPALVLEGRFNGEESRDAVAALVASGTDFDAIAAANDHMALGALEALQAADVDVPGRVSLIGFDDIDETLCACPAIATVRQRLVQQGRLAVEMLLDHLEGRPYEVRVQIQTALVPRASCGCLGGMAPRQGAAGMLEDEPTRLRRQCSEEIARSVETVSAAWGESTGAWFDELHAALLADLDGTGVGGFLPLFFRLVQRTDRVGGDVAPWRAVLSALRRRLTDIDHDEARLLRLEDLAQQALSLLGEVHEARHSRGWLRRQVEAKVFQEVGQNLLAAFDLSELMETVAAELPRVGIEECHLALFEPGDPEHSRLALAFGPEGRRELPAGDDPYPTREFAPLEAGLWSRRRTLIVQSLFFRDEAFGLALMEMGTERREAMYTPLRDYLSSSLKRAFLVEAMEVRSRELAHSNEELAQAYRTLQDSQEKMLQIDKMASLGRLTAGIAHEMNTPLAAVRSSVSIVRKLAEEYRDSLDDQSVTPDDHREIATEMLHSLELSEKAAERAASFVRGIKLQTRDLQPGESQRFDAASILRETLLLLGFALRQGKCTAAFEAPDDKIELVGSPGKLSQIVTNLVTNAIDASQSKGGCEIRIALGQSGERIVLSVADSGTGIPPEILKRIFEPMFSTKPFGQGTGLGLTIVQSLVTAAFGGEIQVDSVPGVGTTFTMIFPVR